MKKKKIFKVDGSTLKYRNKVPTRDTTTLNNTTMIEDLIKEHIEALRENTAALKAASSCGSAPAAAETEAPKEKKTRASKTADTSKEETKEKPVTLDDIRNFVKGERQRLKDTVSPEAVVRHKEATQKIYKELGVSDIGGIAEKDTAKALALFKAIDVSSTPDAEDEDDDL